MEEVLPKVNVYCVAGEWSKVPLKITVCWSGGLGATEDNCVGVVDWKPLKITVCWSGGLGATEDNRVI